jgi:NAD(P)-dependent dehydrogenase (short-subunit alcohol dehydrogenase family)
MDNGPFKNRVAVVAGGGSGIGAATAQLLAEDGCAVVVADLSGDAAAKVAAGINESGGNALGAQADIALEDSVSRLFTTVQREFGRLDHIVNVAADMSPETMHVDDQSDALTIPRHVWDRTFAVDLTGYLLVIRGGLPLILAGGGGSIVNVSSEASVLGLGDKPAYSCAKAGVDALTRHVARRWAGEGVRCNAVSPGMVMTEGLKAMYGDVAYGTDAGIGIRVRGTNPSGRPGEPRELAAAIRFLLSDDASWITGQVLHVSGGMVFGK